MNHDTMRRASELPVAEGPAASPTLAASGGLELPARQAHAPEAPGKRQAHEPIPGEHDATTDAGTGSAIGGTTGYGGDLLPSDSDPTLDEESRRTVRWESGGRTK